MAIKDVRTLAILVMYESRSQVARRAKAPTGDVGVEHGCRAAGYA